MEMFQAQEAAMRTKRHDGRRDRTPSDHDAMLALMRRVNCNDRREPAPETLEIEAAVLRTQGLAAATYLSALF